VSAVASELTAAPDPRARERRGSHRGRQDWHLRLGRPLPPAW
jgi:hypothetical protein